MKIARTQKTLQRTFALGLAAAASLSLANCGSATGAIDATNAMPAKIDATNAQVTESNKKIDETNGKMDTMVAQVKETNSGMSTMVEQVKKTNDGMSTMVEQVKKTNDGINKTNAAVHNQTLAVALQTMMTPQNTKYMNPAPMAMLPPGQIFANEASSDEIVSLVFTLFQGIQNAFPVTDAAAQVAFNQDKTVDFSVAKVIAGLMPQAKVDEMIRNQIDLGGRYQTTAYQILALRYNFISSLNLAGDLMPSDDGGGLVNIGLLAEAVKDVDALTMIAKLPYVAKISYKFTTFYPSATGDDQNPQFDLSSVWNHSNILWKKLRVAAAKLATGGDATSPQVIQSSQLKAKIDAEIAAPVKKPGSPTNVAPSPTP